MTTESALFALGFWHQFIEVLQPFVIIVLILAWGLSQAVSFAKNNWIAGLLRLVFFVTIPWLGYQLLPAEKLFNQFWVDSGRPLPNYKRSSVSAAGRTELKHPELYRQGQGVAWVSIVLLFAGGSWLGLAIFSRFEHQFKDHGVNGDSEKEPGKENHLGPASLKIPTDNDAPGKRPRIELD
ncbi:MAG: hypothetical protein WAV95_18900 [Azonexus sp.]